jgi:membrane-bound lytic murein transglycosylase A
MAMNRSYIFFAETPQGGAAPGPLAAASVPLTPGRSLAVDRTLHTFGAPVFVATRDAFPGLSGPFRRLTIAQDTGSAILGPARGDIFCGSGEAAGEIAGHVRHAADFWQLRPRGAGVR